LADNLYTYAVARIRSKELSLLNQSDIDHMMNCNSENECLRFLADKGWVRADEENAQQILNDEKGKTWQLIRELVSDMSVFDTFLYSSDFHNLKAAIKQVYSNHALEDIYLTDGTVNPELILSAAREHDFSTLPDYLRACAEEAYQVLLHTENSQLCDSIIDKATLDTILKKGKSSGIELLSQYAELKVASADIHIALRCLKTGKKKDFIKQALAECDSLNVTSLADAVLEGEDAIYHYLESTVYSDAVEAIKISSSAFERWCDNLIISHIRPQKYNPFTVSPLAAYILARENEIKTVRILLSGKRNQISDDLIRERLREMYV
jgi:V/A-type H+-transporting ATPase subunit C